MEKKVLLFSGGFDSRLQEWLIKPDVLLYVDMKTSYSEIEISALKKLPKRYTDRLIIKDLPLGEYERENKYLPYRNLILATIAMEYGQHVYFGFNKMDNAPDKDKKFISKVTALFKHLNKNCEGDMGWENTNFSFNAPFKSLTKTEMVSLCLRKGMTIKDIQTIRSCYDGKSEIGCGVCPVCINKAIALINNGIYDDKLFDTPITVETLEQRLDTAIQNEYKKSYIHEIEHALKLLRQAKK